MYIHDPTVDIAKLFEPEEASSMSRVVEGKALVLGSGLVIA